MSDRIGSAPKSTAFRLWSNHCSRGRRPRSYEGLVNTPGSTTSATALTIIVIINPAEGEA